ncbi:hypothetical protein TWF481_012270 [Arthrobotrys musiformis]|uniref:Uncharacterized protein n=1 Tax=Arthrobotrys musiformis TaxID=47236 RepID=A0AAV9VXY3_9PEZI
MSQVLKARDTVAIHVFDEDDEERWLNTKNGEWEYEYSSSFLARASNDNEFSDEWWTERMDKRQGRKDQVDLSRDP